LIQLGIEISSFFSTLASGASVKCLAPCLRCPHLVAFNPYLANAARQEHTTQEWRMGTPLTCWPHVKRFDFFALCHGKVLRQEKNREEVGLCTILARLTLPVLLNGSNCQRAGIAL